MDYSKEQYYKMQQMLANQSYKAVSYAEKTPFYMAYPMQSLYMTEMEYEKDMERMKELYPSEAKRAAGYIEEECDRLEYEGSMMFDEYPDRLMLRRICDRVYEKVTQERMTQEQVAQEEVTQQQACRDCDSDRKREPRPNRRREDDGMWNLIEVLLYNEMYKRRCRYKRCRRWW